MSLFRAEPGLIAPAAALPGRSEVIPVAELHAVSGHPMQGPFAAGMEQAQFGLGCFWGAERKLWQLEGVYTTAVGYAGGSTPNPLYDEVCSGQTGHAEVVRVVFEPARISYRELLAVFWESHDPTQGMRQGNDCGTQYRSVIHCYTDAQMALATASREAYAMALGAAGYPVISTEVAAAPRFYFAEDYHQQYLAKNPGGYCGLGGTGVALGPE